MSQPNLKAILDGQVDSIASQDHIRPVPVGYCVECEDQPYEIHCQECCDDFCQVCFTHQHRKGSRRKHSFKLLNQEKTAQKQEASVAPQTAQEFIEQVDMEIPVFEKDWLLERSKFIPLRLSLEERKLLRLLDAGLNVSEYTDRIDIVAYGSKSKRIVAQIKELCSILSGLVLAADYKVGQELFQDRDFKANQEFYQDM